MKANKLTLDALNRESMDSFKKKSKLPIHVVLEDIRSGMNVGSFFRTADGLALEGISLIGITAQPPHKEILKTAIGASEVIPWSHYANITDCLNVIRGNKQVISVEQTDASFELQKLADQQFEWQNGIILIFGNEVQGVSEEAIKASDFCCEIPQFGTKHSFNVAVCGGMVLWEFSKMYRYC